MITLITGAPGAGKTAALVKLLRDLAADRAIFVDGIPDLKVKHVPLADARQWPIAVPDGAAVVIDEVQRVWRPAGAGQRIPEDIALLETHRHRGLDFFIVTQHPKLLHANVRALVGRHVHLRDIGVLGRWWYEWPECTDVASWRSAPVKKRYRLDKASFALYRSASEHVKPIRSLPPVVLFLGAAVVGVGVLGWFTYKAISSRMGGTSQVLAGPAAAASAPLRLESRAPVVSEAAITARLVNGFTPRVPGRPETAPAYDAVRIVLVAERVVGGYCQADVCYCYNNQGLRSSISDSSCRDWIAHPPFDPYRVPSVAGVVPGARTSPVAVAVAAAPVPQ